MDEFKDISNGAQKEDIYLKEKTKPAPQGIKQEMHTDKLGKKSKPMIIALIALVVLAGVGVACYFAFFSSSKQQKPAEKTTGQQISASAPREEAVVFGDVENADEKVKTGLGTFLVDRYTGDGRITLRKVKQHYFKCCRRWHVHSEGKYRYY